MNEKPDPPHPGNRAFTRVDLLALMASSALLLFIVLPALGRVTGKTAIAQCAANLEQYDMALQIYGGENQDNLPNNGQANPGAWPWDAPLYLTDWLTNIGVKWTSLYCPGTSARFTEQDNLTLWIYYAPWRRLLGYASTLPYIGTMESTVGTYSFSTNINTTLNMQRVNLSGTNYPVIPASRVLVADSTLTYGNGVPPPAGPALNAAMLTCDWVNISFYPLKPGISAHLNGLLPLGGNVGMLDGHVEWRDFTNMLPRAGGVNGEAFFYW
jgi:prepilin-type processing-associated H-X9-DG protein